VPLRRDHKSIIVCCLARRGREGKWDRAEAGRCQKGAPGVVSEVKVVRVVFADRSKNRAQAGFGP
jgi:hypothetical protein